jgi:hypothetical protein
MSYVQLSLFQEEMKVGGDDFLLRIIDKKYDMKNIDKFSIILNEKLYSFIKIDHIIKNTGLIRRGDIFDYIEKNFKLDFDIQASHYHNDLFNRWFLVHDKKLLNTRNPYFNFILDPKLEYWFESLKYKIFFIGS